MGWGGVVNVRDVKGLVSAFTEGQGIEENQRWFKRVC